MSLSHYIIPFVLLLVTTSITARSATSHAFSLSILDQSLNILNKLRQMKSGSYSSGSGYTDQMLEVLSSQIETLQGTTDRNHNVLFEKLDDLPQGILFLTDRKTLSENYGDMKETWKKLVKDQMLINNGSIVPLKDDLPPMQDIVKSYEKTRRLVTTQDFFTKLSSNWKDTYGKPWDSPCYTYMSDLQVRYALFLEYMNFVRNFFMSKCILFAIYETIDWKDYSRNKQTFSLHLQQDFNKDLGYVKDILKKSSREYWTCDPNEGMGESSFYELQAYTTYYTVKENIEMPCDKNCSNVSVQSCKSEYDDGLCEKTRKCPQNLLSCSLSYGMNICHNDLNAESYRRYAFIAERYNGKECNRTISTLKYESQVEIYDIKLSKKDRDNRLDYFNCICREHRYYVNTFPVTASPGHVIVGVELKLKDYALYIDVLQGKLEPDGSVKNATYSPIFSDQPEWSKFNATLAWNDEIDLNPTLLPEDQNLVITGVQFVKTGRRLHLALHAKEINLTTGEFIPGSSKILKKTAFGTEELKLGNVDRPNKTNQENIEISNDNQYVKFNVTGLLEDGGQTTVPFIDNRQVLPENLSPLSGISFYVRGKDGYGGFLALKVYTFDVSQYIRDKNTSYSIGEDVQEDMGLSIIQFEKELKLI